MSVWFHKDGTLPSNKEPWIWVFGSNLDGRHGRGAAKVAVTKFGAMYGKAVGYQGRSYAIPTKDSYFKTLSLHEIKFHVNVFEQWCNDKFVIKPKIWVTRVGCGLAGYDDKDIAPLFRDCDNCSFAEEWKEFLI